MIRVKICGITNWDDAKAACDAGANWVGFNFYSNSLRRVSTAEAAQIRSKLPKDVEAIGIFVNASPGEIRSLMSLVPLHAAQLHGDETPEIAARVAQSVSVIKALRVSAGFPLSTLDSYREVLGFLLDGARPGQYGGSGQTADWALAKRAAASHRILLAGGLTPDNVAEAVRTVCPWGVDVASGIESKPGKKDHAKMRAFVDAVRSAEKEIEVSAKGASTQSTQ
jgi:phosphoribosylanthranilate isomerase